MNPTIELNTYNNENAKYWLKSKISILIDYEKGVFSLTKAAVELMKLSDQDFVEIHQDKKRPKDWYISKCLTPEAKQKGFKLRENGAGVSLCFNSVKTARALLSSIDVYKNASFIISTEPNIFIDGLLTLELFPIITSTIKP